VEVLVVFAFVVLMSLPQQMTRLAQTMVDSMTKKMVMTKMMVMKKKMVMKKMALVWAQRMVDSMTKKKKMMNSMTMKLDVLHLQHPHPLAVHHRLRKREKQTNDIIAP
jgi:hypothetical protein